MIFIHRIVNSFFTSNTFVITHKDSPYCWLIDIGDIKPVLKIVAERQVKGVLLTHSHYDHIYGINELLEKYPQCRVYTSEYGSIALKDNKKNLSLFNECPMTYNGDVSIIRNGDRLCLFDDTELEVVETPGHCCSCLSYVVNNYIFTGDSYIPNIPVVTNLPKGNKRDSIVSVNKILSLSNNKVICPGHGPRTKSK